MRRDDLHYELPPELIAQQPAEPRDSARLMILRRDQQRIEHSEFRALPRLLARGDLLVTNDSRVLPARFHCTRATGGRVEALFLHEVESGAAWHVLLKPSARQRVGDALAIVGSACVLRLEQRLERGVWRVRPEPPLAAEVLLSQVGQLPLPPYIERAQGPLASDLKRYQTVYAQHPGSVAAPTAGLHFTPELLAQLAAGGVQQASVTLHVGLGTFQPIESEDLADHAMHAEWFECSAAAAELMQRAQRSGGRLVAVGTTAVRVLESLPDWPPAAVSGWTNLFVYPPRRVSRIDGLITNFHLPGSTLLALVMAFGGVELVRRAYALAVAQRYRFYSYGDAMLIL